MCHVVDSTGEDQHDQLMQVIQAMDRILKLCAEFPQAIVRKEAGSLASILNAVEWPSPQDSVETPPARIGMEAEHQVPPQISNKVFSQVSIQAFSQVSSHASSQALRQTSFPAAPHVSHQSPCQLGLHGQNQVPTQHSPSKSDSVSRFSIVSSHHEATFAAREAQRRHLEEDQRMEEGLALFEEELTRAQLQREKEAWHKHQEFERRHLENERRYEEEKARMMNWTE